MVIICINVCNSPNFQETSGSISSIIFLKGYFIKKKCQYLILLSYQNTSKLYILLIFLAYHIINVHIKIYFYLLFIFKIFNLKWLLFLYSISFESTTYIEKLNCNIMNLGTLIHISQCIFILLYKCIVLNFKLTYTTYTTL